MVKLNLVKKNGTKGTNAEWTVRDLDGVARFDGGYMEVALWLANQRLEARRHGVARTEFRVYPYDQTMSPLLDVEFIDEALGIVGFALYETLCMIHDTGETTEDGTGLEECPWCGGEREEVKHLVPARIHAHANCPAQMAGEAIGKK